MEQLTTPQSPVQLKTGYSRFVKIMRILLPLLAAALIVIMMTWSELDDKTAILPKEDVLQKSNMGENELLNPRFETTDSQQRPVHVEAERALQNQDNPNIVQLESPKANLKMKDGSGLTIESATGTYEQKVEKLYLETDVQIHHESGYDLMAEELRVDMKTREVWSDKTVHIEGPDGTISASGLEGNVGDGVLIFKGPVTLKLNTLDGNPVITNTETPTLEQDNEAP